MPYNKNAGYGLERVASINAGANIPGRLAFGRTLYCVKSTDNYYDAMVDLFPIDPEGNVRLFTTVTAAITALKDHDTLIIGSGYWNEAAKLTLSGFDGVRILGCNTGMQWGEGGTCIGDETSADDLLDITGCKNIEIAGIMFYNTTSEKDGINFSGLNYSVHIHDCCFIGDVGGGTVMENGIDCQGANGPDTYIHHCKFFRCENAAISLGTQRSTVEHCFFVVPASGKGIINGETSTGFNRISDNYFLGAKSSDIGISVSGAGAGYAMYTHNWFANLSSEIETSVDENCLENYYADYTTGGGVVAVCDPEA